MIDNFIEFRNIQGYFGTYERGYPYYDTVAKRSFLGVKYNGSDIRSESEILLDLRNTWRACLCLAFDNSEFTRKQGYGIPSGWGQGATFMCYRQDGASFPYTLREYRENHDGSGIELLGNYPCYVLSYVMDAVFGTHIGNKNIYSCQFQPYPVSQSITYLTMSQVSDYDGIKASYNPKTDGIIPVFRTASDVAGYWDSSDPEQYIKDHAIIDAPSTEWKVYLSDETKPEITLTANMRNAEITSMYLDMGTSPDIGGLIPPLTWNEIGEFNGSKWVSNWYTLKSQMGLFNKLALSTSIFPNIWLRFTAYYENDGIKSTSQCYCVIAQTGNSTSNPHGVWHNVTDDGSTVEIIMGYPTGSGNEDYYSETDTNDTVSDAESIATTGGGYSTNGVGNRQYVLNVSKTNQLCNWLWNTDITDTIIRWSSSPIENIVSLKMFPFSIVGGANTDVYVGNLKTNVNAPLVGNSYNAVRTVANGTVSKMYESFLDLDGYTNLSIYLPFIGIKELSASACMGKTLKVCYITDIITGMCKAMIYVNNQLLYEYSGSMGIEIALTSSNRAQVESSFLASAVGTVVSLATENYVGAVMSVLSGANAQVHSQTTGNFSPNCEGYSPMDIILIYDRPDYQNIDSFNHTHGRMCNLSLNIGSCKGFTKCAEGVDLSSISATGEEKEELLSILTTGFFI